MKDFEKNKQAFKQVCLLAIIILTLFIHSLVLSYLITFQKRFKAAHNGEENKRIQGGGERQKGKQEASVEWTQ